MESIEVDSSKVFEPQVEGAGKQPLEEHWADLMFGLADEDYLCYSVFSHARFMVRIALYHLEQAVEKYLKAFYLGAMGPLPPRLQTHRLPELLTECAAVEPALGTRSLAIFCRHLADYSELARYPDPSRLYLGFRRFTADVDRAVTSIRTLAKTAIGQPEKELVERIIDRDGEWSPNSGTLYGPVLPLLAEAFREALLAPHDEF